MEPSSTPRTNPRRGLRRPDYGLLQQRDFKRTSTIQYGGMTTTQRSTTTESFVSTSRVQQNFADGQAHADSENNPFLVTETFDQSHPTPRATTTKTGLRRPDYGPMQSHVFRNQPTTPHVISRRTLVDESLIEAMIHTHLRAPGTGSTNFTATQRNDDAMVNQRTTVEEPMEPSRSTWDDNLFAAADNSEFANPPQTPKRESRSFTMAPGSGRRTPRRRSRSSNQHLRTTPIKALADANEARVNRLILEANKRGRVGRDKHSPMGILRQLSRIPGFNPVPKPSPDREPLPGSANWRKLTPRSTRTRHIDVSGTIDNPFKTLAINRDSHVDTESASRSTEHAGMSSAKRRAIDRFKDDNPFLAPEDYDRLWEEEIDVARNRMSRESFGQMFSGGVGELLPGDDDTRDLSLAHQDLTDQFFAPTEREARSPYIGDITGHSAKGFEDQEAHDSAQSQIPGVSYLLQGVQDASRTSISAQDSSVLLPSDTSDALGGAVRGSDDTAEGLSGEKQGLIGSDNVRGTEEGSPDQDKDVDVDMNEGWEDIPDDELTQDFLSQQGTQASAVVEQASGVFGEDDQARDGEGQYPLAGQGHIEAETVDKEDQDIAAVDNNDQDMIALNNEDQGTDLGHFDEHTQDVGEHTQAIDEHNLDVNGQLDDADRLNLDEQLGDADGHNLDVDKQLDGSDGANLDVDEQNHDIPVAAGDQDPAAAHDDGQDREAQYDQEFEDGYMNVNEDDHIEQQEHEEQHGKSGVQYFDDFPSELGIMSNGNVLPTSFPKIKKIVRRSRAGIPVPGMPTSLQKQLVHTFSRSRMSREAMDIILEGSHLFFEQAANDLAAYANHAGRKTVDESDVELLMKRLRIIHDKVSMESLLQRYLPRELRDKVLFPEDMPSAHRR